MLDHYLVIISKYLQILRKSIKKNRNIAGKNLVVNGSKSARRYQVKTSGAGISSGETVRFQSLSMSATSDSHPKNNHVATQNNVMMNSVAVDASQNYP